MTAMDERLAALIESYADEANWRANGDPSLWRPSLIPPLIAVHVAMTLEAHRLTRSQPPTKANVLKPLIRLVRSEATAEAEAERANLAVLRAEVRTIIAKAFSY